MCDDYDRKWFPMLSTLQSLFVTIRHLPFVPVGKLFLGSLPNADPHGADRTRCWFNPKLILRDMLLLFPLLILKLGWDNWLSVAKGQMDTHQPGTQCTLTSQGLSGHSLPRADAGTPLVVIALSELEVVKKKPNWDKEMQDTAIYVLPVFLAQRRPHVHIVKR